MATPMTGPVLPRNDSKTRGRRWLFLSVLSAMAVAWAVDSNPPGGGRLLGSVPVSRDGDTGSSLHVTLRPAALPDAVEAPETPISRALRAIEDCQTRYDSVHDYVCTFSKRERIDGRLTTLHVMSMKVRTRPSSIYLKFRQPSPGREAIYIAGRNEGKVLAHDVGLKRLLAGTLTLEPTCEMAMEDCRHPITHAGIGPLLDTIEAPLVQGA